MPWKILINGVDKTTSIDQKSRVTINLERNERGTASFTCKNGYMPAMREEVLIYDTDGITLIFGGIVFDRRTKGVGLLTFMEIDCVDWSIYTTWRTMTYTFTGVWSLLQVLQLIVNNYLDDYGISLSGSQVTGPSVDTNNYVVTGKKIEETLRLVTTYSGGYTWSINPSKVLEMVLNTAAPAAPYTITDANSNVQEIDWNETSSEYATKIVMLCGGTGTKELQQTWTVSAGDAANGYLETTVPSTPTGGVSLTVNGTPRSIGGSGNEFTWNWATHRITPGTSSGSIGQVFVLNYTGQYPFVATYDSGTVPPIESVESYDDVTSIEMADEIGAGLLSRCNQTPKHFEIETVTKGFRPGQALTINVSGRTTGSVVALITAVEITLISDGFWRHSIKASTGIFQNSSLEYFRSLSSGTAPSPISGFTTGINPGSVSAIVTGLFLGGSRNEAVAVNPAAYTPVPNYSSYRAQTSFSGLVRAELWARNAAIGCTARLWDVTAGAAVGTSSLITSTSPTSTSFSVTIVGGNVYRLEILSSAVDEGVYGIGTLESV